MTEELTAEELIEQVKYEEEEKKAEEMLGGKDVN